MGVRISVVLFAAVTVRAFDARGATLNVPADFATIQACIDAAVSGVDECVVAPGTYNEAINFNGKAITLRSSGGADVTIIDGTGVGGALIRCLSGEGPNTILEGFTIRNASNHGMFNGDSSPTIRDCIFRDNYAGAQFGGAIYNFNSSPSISGCTFRENSAAKFGGAIAFADGSNAIVSQCTFADNFVEIAVGGALFVGESDVVIAHCTFTGNRNLFSFSNPGAAITFGFGTLTLTHCVFSGNTAVGSSGSTLALSGGVVDISNCAFSNNIVGPTGSAIRQDSGGSTTINNSILHANTSGQIIVADPGSSTVTVRRSIVQGGLPVGVTDGGGNLNTDPLFADADGADNTAGTPDDDLRLTSGSPAIDAGDNTLVTLDTVDADGDLDTSERTPRDLADMPRFCDDPADADTGVPDPGPPMIDNIVDMGAYEFRRAVFVNDDAIGANDGSSWADAHATLQNGLVDAERFDAAVEVWVAAGTYRPDQGSNRTSGDRSATFQLLNGVGLYGGFAGSEGSRDARDWTVNEAILTGDLNGDDGPAFANNGENSYHVVTGSGTDSSAILDGFTVTRGNANTDPNDLGGGMYNSGGGPTVTHCEFSGNSAGQDGGGMFNFNSGPIVTNCLFSGNAAMGNGGAGMFNTGSSTTVTNCLFTENTAIGGAGCHGGGMYNFEGGIITVTGCRFVRNSTSANGGGMYNNASGPIVSDSWFGGNDANQGGGVFNFSSSPKIVNSAFTGNFATVVSGGLDNSASSNPDVINCTFSRNSTSGSGGGLTTGSGSNALLKVFNCIFWENEDSGGMDESAQIHVGATAPTVRFTGIQGLSAGGVFDSGSNTNNLGNDPLFVDADGLDDTAGTDDDDLRLGMGSPCFDAGDNTAAPADSADLDNDADTTERVPLDLDGSSRFADMTSVTDTGVADPPDYPAVVDMGAYERSPCLSADDCGDDDLCTHDACVADFCANSPRKFGDVNNDGMVDIFDILCVLDGFAGTFNPPCTLTNLDLAGCPGGDGSIDIFDILAVLDGFAGVNTCNCPAGP
ncbi:MAG: hypothetical protein HOP29_06665 [Phycisphaerales bacterium]|nr:hypothetical protein [Phycisphaerales bacterium]